MLDFLRTLLHRTTLWRPSYKTLPFIPLAFCPRNNVLRRFYQPVVNLGVGNSTTKLVTLCSADDTICIITFSSDDAYIACGTASGSVIVFDAVTGVAVARGVPAPPSSENSTAVALTALSWHPNGTFIASASACGLVNLWAIASRQHVRVIMEGLSVKPSPIIDIGFSSDGSMLAVGFSTGIAYAGDVGDLDEFSVVTLRKVEEPGNHWVFTTSIPPYSLPEPTQGDRVPLIHLPGDRRDLMCSITGQSSVESEPTFLPFSCNGSQLAMAYHTNGLIAVDIRDASSGELLVEPIWPLSGVTSLSLSHKGHKIAIAGTFSIEIRDLHASISHPFLRGLTSHITSSAFSPNGRLVALGYVNGAITIHDATTGKRNLGPIQLHPKEVIAIEFSQSGTRVVSSSVDKSTSMSRVWDVKDGVILRTINVIDNWKDSTIRQPLKDQSATFFSEDWVLTWYQKLHSRYGRKRRHWYTIPELGYAQVTSPSETIQLLEPEFRSCPALSDLRFASVSPDGKMVIFASSTMLSVQDVVTNELLLQSTTPSGARMMKIFWSSDGTSIFVLMEEGSLFLLALTARQVNNTANIHHSREQQLETNTSSEVTINITPFPKGVDRNASKLSVKSVSEPVQELECTKDLPFQITSFSCIARLPNYGLYGVHIEESEPSMKLKVCTFTGQIVHQVVRRASMGESLESGPLSLQSPTTSDVDKSSLDGPNQSY